MSSAAAAGASSPAEPVGRKRVDTKEVAVLEEDINDTVSLRFWFRAGAVAVCVTTVPTVIGIATAHVEHAVAMPDVKMWYKCWGPNIVLMLAEIAAASLMAPRIGFDMIEERSNNISIKESMRSIITSQGLIAALFLLSLSEFLFADGKLVCYNAWSFSFLRKFSYSSSTFALFTACVSIQIGIIMMQLVDRIHCMFLEQLLKRPKPSSWIPDP